ncbi:UV radiation resistance-associated protein [Frankliniella fusca]|uniref:UV radiation resistance-associated protein n=1 Tax=Frankliniella fusca TaxID=407009 RepID=A0AAE1LI46_9NEOP|nr:UV radiation resistance-associated protein [Frankliniella fusca]
MSLSPQRASSRWKEWSPTPRWKEWIPLITQQQRLRSMVQVTAYNVPWYPGSSLYFTLHQTVMSPPFYTSERLHHQHPKWGEIEVSGLPSSVNISATGLVIRLWLHQEQQSQDSVILVWGVYFSGLVYLGPRLTANASHFNENAIVLHMQGGYFTDKLSVKELPCNATTRYLSTVLSVGDTRPSYSIALLLRLRNIQQAIKKLSLKSGVLRDKILAGGMSSEDANISRESNPTIRRLLSKGRPKPPEKQETRTLLCQVEVLRFRVALLRQERQRKLAQLECLEKKHDLIASDNADLSCELTERYQNLHKEVEHLREKRRHHSDMFEAFVLKNSQLSFRRKNLLSQLSHIYPVTLTDGKYTICGIHLPNSEDLSNADDVSVSVALGFVAHLVQMVSIFLQIPLRYPIIHFGSRSKIIDHISDKIPDREREFPLFARGKDKLQFHYGVYLLNKNIAQLRWQVGFPTNDLRATLHNVYHLVHLNQFSALENHHRSMSGSSLDVFGSSVNVSPVGSVTAVGTSHDIVISPNQLRARHRSSKSMGSTELLFPSGKRTGSYTPLPHHVSSDGLASSANLSYSLDKGLDEYEEIKSVYEDAVSIGGNPLNGNAPSSSSSNLAYVGSEPNLVIASSNKSVNGGKDSVTVIEANIETPLVKDWKKVREAVPTSSDDETPHALVNITNKSEFTLVTERLAELVDSSKSFGDSAAKGVNLKQAESISKNPMHNNGLGSQMAACNLAKSTNAALLEKLQCDGDSIKELHTDEVSSSNIVTEPSSSKLNENKPDLLSCSKVSGDIEVDVGTDALTSISSTNQNNVYGKGNVSNSRIRKDPQNNTSGKNLHETNQDSEESRVECVGVEESVLVDNLFANVASRTEALASHTTSFNLMSSRHGST